MVFRSMVTNMQSSNANMSVLIYVTERKREVMGGEEGWMEEREKLPKDYKAKDLSLGRKAIHSYTPHQL